MKNLDEHDSGSRSNSDWGCLLLMILPLVWFIFRSEPQALSLKGFAVVVIMIASGRGLSYLAIRFQLPESIRVISLALFSYLGIVTVLRSAEISTFKQWGDQLFFQGGASGGLPHFLGAIVAIFFSLNLIAANRGGLRNLFHIAGPKRIERYQAAGGVPGRKRDSGKENPSQNGQDTNETSTD